MTAGGADPYFGVQQGVLVSLANDGSVSVLKPDSINTNTNSNSNNSNNSNKNDGSSVQTNVSGDSSESDGERGTMFGTTR